MASIRRDEAERLNALQQLNLLDTPPSESFDRITRMAANIFGLPIAAVSLTDRDRQWFKSRVGVDHWSIPREKAPCAAVAETAEFVLIPDLLADPCYSTSVLAAQGVRYYAGASLVTREGYGLGALCVLGTEPRETSEAEKAALRDLAAMVMAQVELQHAFGRVDPVSGLPSRTQMLEDLEDLARDNAGERRIAALVDLAAPEQISSGLRVVGPGFMDTMIKQAVPLIRAALKPVILYHVAPTQFAVVINGESDAGRYVERVVDRLFRARGEANRRMVASLSIGVLPFELGRMTPGDVIRAAYGAALDARTARIVASIHSDSSDFVHRRRFQILRDFEAALDENSGQLRLVLQPRVDLETGEWVGGEALIRWNHPVLGEVLPSEFIPLIEHSPFARPMTSWVLEKACVLLAGWRRKGIALQLSINVSAANLEEEDFAERVQLTMLKHRLPAGPLEIEITESAAMTNAGRSADQLAALDEAQIPIAIDDFGTGYSSLSYLQKLPARTIKIDQAFIREMDVDEKGKALVRSMISLFRDLGYRVVAEGIETEAAADLLREMRCHEAQGYWFARPLELSDFNERLTAPAGASQAA